MLVDTQNLVAPERFTINSTNFAHSPLVTMIEHTVFKTTFHHANERLMFQDI